MFLRPSFLRYGLRRPRWTPRHLLARSLRVRNVFGKAKKKKKKTFDQNNVETVGTTVRTVTVVSGSQNS